MSSVLAYIGFFLVLFFFFCFVFSFPYDGGQRSRVCEGAVGIEDGASVDRFDDWSLDLNMLGPSIIIFARAND